MVLPFQAKRYGFSVRCFRFRDEFIWHYSSLRFLRQRRPIGAPHDFRAHVIAEFLAILFFLRLIKFH